MNAPPERAVRIEEEERELDADFGQTFEELLAEMKMEDAQVELT